ncbi:MAG: alpha/beta fold hydrolase [Rhodoplanes sp.]|uniref:alpha/beta fold hydrolase n=1 Tax=Rhodoplanes sp. TaxID=1968906 RepID=UPI001826D038|nr:alpha/beta fold hydrolase [Rhodoplanes sp.]NVO13423.1 alpha/beta fold hydrolase [Rhodoplanes sp.]
MPMLERPDGELPYEVVGEGPPLALVSGLGGAAAYWSNLVPVLSRAFSVILHDHMATGRSRSRRKVHSVEALAADLDALLTHLGCAHCSLIGHSTGAAVGQVLAQDYPGRLDKLVLYGGWAGPDPHFAHCFKVRRRVLTELGVPAYNEIGPLFLYPPLWISRNPDKVAKIIADNDAMAPAAADIAARIDMIVAFDRRARMGEIRTPTFVVCAADDILTPPHLSEELAAGIPGAHLALVPWGGHACSQTAPEEFLATVLPFLRGR